MSSENFQSRPKGVMDASYAADRTRLPHLTFRYQARALAAARAFRELGPGVEKPKILDLGSAEGRTLAETHRLLEAHESLGIEFAPDLVTSAGSLPQGVRVIEGDATAPPPEVQDGSFDLVTALAVLEHLEDPRALAQAAVRALKPGGILVASCPVPLWDGLSGALGLHKDEHHETAFDQAAFWRLADDVDLIPVRYSRFMFVPVAFLPYLKIPISPTLANRIDRIVALPRVFDFLFVNQLFVARRR